MVEKAAQLHAAAPACAHVETETENGYRIARVCEPHDGAPEEPGTYSFMVSDQAGQQRRVVVEFAPAVIAAVQQRRPTPLTPGSPFWLACAERALAQYLWEQEQYPPAGRLVLREACADDVELARRWHD